MNAPGLDFLPGQRQRASIRGVFLFYCLGSLSVLRRGKNAASLKQIRAALSFVYKHWDLKNPFAKIEPPLHKARLKYSGQTRLIPGQIAPYFAPGPTIAW